MPMPNPPSPKLRFCAYCEERLSFVDAVNELELSIGVDMLSTFVSIFGGADDIGFGDNVWLIPSECDFILEDGKLGLYEYPTP